MNFQRFEEDLYKAVESNQYFSNLVLINELGTAIINSDVKQIHEILFYDPNLINYCNNHWSVKTLFLSRAVNDKKITDLLFYFFRDINFGSPSDLALPLDDALKNGNVRLVEFLLMKGAFVRNFGIIFDKTIMKFDIHIKVLTLFLKYKVIDTHFVNEIGQNFLHRYIDSIIEDDSKDSVEVVKILVDFGFSVSKSDNRGFKPLYYCARKGYLRLASFLVEKKARVNCQTSSLKTPLHVAVENGNEEFVNFLILNGADINAKEYRGVTPLHIACFRHHEEIIRLLIRRGANISAQLNNGYTPLSYLVPTKKGYDTCCRVMIREFSKLHFEKISIFQRDMDMIQKNREARDYFENCTAELKNLSSTKFYGAHTYYSVLKESISVEKLASLMNNSEIVLEFFENSQQFVYYNGDLKKIWKEAIKIRKKFEDVKSRLEFIFNDCLPEIVIRNLANNLTLDDLPLN